METLREQIGARLVQLRGEEPQVSFARRMNVHRNSLGRYEAGDAEVGADLLNALFVNGYNPHWVLTGQGSMRGGIVEVQEPDTSRFKIPAEHAQRLANQDGHESEFVRIKRYRTTRLAAGNGQLGDDTDDVDWLQFRRQYLAFIGLSPKNAAIVRIKGDSMETMLMDGDTVMIDLTDTTIYPPARSFDRRRAYAIKRITGETALVQCKFVELVREDGAEFTQVSSFNEQYACERVGEGNEIQVIGRIRWHGHTWF